MFFVNNYALLYIKAINVNTNIFKQESIKIALWPTNSLDLNPIEPYWVYEKDIFEEYDIRGTIAEKL